MLQLLRKIAFPISLVYALVVYVRNFLFDAGIFSSKSYKTPTICVGNLSVGGTGKTPMTEYLLRILTNRKTAVLSRGYKRRSKGFYLAGTESTVLELGDEPYQIHRKFPQVAVAVDADRRNGIEKLESGFDPEVIVLDDAFQHRRVKPTFSILLTTYHNLYVDDWYLPMGSLRDAKKEAKRADLIIVTKCPDTLQDVEWKKVIDKLKPKPDQNVLFAKLKYNDFVTDGGKQKIQLSELKGKPLALVTGIASPEPLVRFLKSVGIVFEHFEFGDHHHFTDREVEQFKGYQMVLTTEKDFVRLEGRLQNLYFLEITHNFSREDEAVLKGSLQALF
ncbi:tetraacyldisaccharide 4'-kinase [Flagellimonas halotolerans]|uniref:Tetraacyldisaccharide 4'-kinase n=1 Tax=Flagellimonas halotolerans TaxID=3112164 RepID=A0ABU6IS52_9FLAO|nr:MULTISPECIES: tetraacyldisaccharide 4'-kinase [unclassified Allomuricauda]MEC3965942.1 tetraacyldisaccharide 4'-kinase [Muricauda sp. SYSU M86414]MEC4265946.1 tetraacyldisaccharide 4'-kinase [Muricauda sp. SYSU M84420]